MGSQRYTMLNHLPRGLPTLDMMLADIGSPTPEQIAKAFAVKPGTVKFWIRTERAPRAVYFALFYVTSWGHAHVHRDAHNDALKHAQFADGFRRELEATKAKMADEINRQTAALKSELQAAKEKLAHLGRIGDFGAAHDPTPEARRSVPTPPLIPADGTPIVAPAVKRRARSKTAQSGGAAC